MKWNTFRAHIKIGFTPLELRAIRKAYVEMEEAHEGETRDAGGPYKIHPIESALSAYDMGERDVEVIVAILMHDILESSHDYGKGITSRDLEKRHGGLAACRVQWMTKFEHTEKHRQSHWEYFRKCRDHKVYKAKCYERLNNVTSFSQMKAKPHETKKARIERKVRETVREFVPIVKWLLADVEVRAFKSEEQRSKERDLIQNIAASFKRELAPYNVAFVLSEVDV
jgi:(p)ppGpp synthase/HD superfamily hydrolase